MSGLVFLIYFIAYIVIDSCVQFAELPRLAALHILIVIFLLAGLSVEEI